MSEKVQNDGQEFSWVYIDIPKEIRDVHDSVTSEIDSNDIYVIDKKDGDWSYGIEDDPHITVKYGLEFDNPKRVIKILDGEKGGNVEIEDIEVFEQDKYDVLVARCKSEALNKIHNKLTDELGIEDKYPEYKPHITLAYFKKGKAKKYVSMAFKGFTYYLLSFDFKSVVFEDRNDKATKIALD